MRMQPIPQVPVADDCAGYPVEMPLDAPTGAELIAALAAVGATPPRPRTLDTVVLVRRCIRRTVRSCATSTTHGSVAVAATCILACDARSALQPGDERVRIHQIGEAPAYAALLALNRRRLIRRLALVRLRILHQRRRQHRRRRKARF